MAQRYIIKNGETVSEAMSWDYDGGRLSFLFFDGAQQPVAVTGVPRVYRTIYNTGDTGWQPANIFATNEWLFNGPCSRIKIDLTGVTGFASYQAVIWRNDDPVPMIPDGAYTGYRGMIAQSYVEANVKTGAQFASSSYFTSLTTGEILDVIVRTGSKKIIIKGQYMAIKDSGDILSDWYKNPTYTGGADVSSGIYNQSDVNPQATTVQIIGTLPTNAAGGDYSPNDATKPNVTALGTKIGPTLATLGTTGIGGSNQSRAAVEGLEQVLQANSVYLYRRTIRAATASLFGFSTWYEGEPDFPIGVN